jgi:flagellar hook-associated protein 2
MATITSTGIGSGLDVGTIVGSLMAIERRPLVQLQTDASGLSSQLSTFGQMQSLTATMRDKAAAIASVTMWNKTSASSSNASVIGAAVVPNGGAVAGAYSIAVSQLATSQSLTSRTYTAATQAVGEGSLTIELGSWSGGTPPTAFAAKSGATPISVSVDATDTLETLRDKINGADGGVSATIITDASGARLSIRSKETGEENAFRISASETLDDGVASSGLSALAYDPSAGVANMTRNEVATNALAKINGIDITSASNTLNEVVDGLTLTLSSVTSAPVQVNVTADTAAVKTAINDFVTAFNALASFIQTQTKYDEASKTGGPLQGDSTVLGFQAQLRGVVNESSSASSMWSTLSDVGITMQKDGTLRTDSTKLDAALTNLPELRKLLATDGSSSAGSGFMDRFRDLGDAVLATDGTFDTRTDSLNARIETNQDRQAQMENRLTLTEARLEAQYQALDASMARLSGLSSYVSQQLSMLNANYTA